VHCALELVKNAPHDVHADASAGYFGDFRGGAEAWLENQVERFLVGKTGSFVGRDEALLNRLLADKRGVNAAAIIAHLDDDLRALMEGVECYGAARGLARSETLVGGLDAVVYGVAHEMHKRLVERVEDALVEIGVFTRNVQGHVLAALFGDVAHDARKAAEELLDRNHADFQDALVQFIQHTGLEAEGLGQLCANRIAGMAAVKLGKSSVEHGFADD
jgi:hypothetical protein